ncbi:MAG: nickel ABC transporter permease subunit NikC [Clostridiales bacterium]|nr:nickel ABC transporter permease subunit NikC [Eubacteriales bacterium]MDH7566184.1 nickel ABC transporter permease subunit NikC [Clostridiales bacterium]
MGFDKFLSRFVKHKAAVLCLFFVLAVIAGGIFAPWLAPNDPNKIELKLKLLGPGGQFPLGTDHLGRCILSRLLYGTRISLGSAFLVMSFSLTIGTAVGIFSAYRGGRIDNLLMRLCDIFLSFPSLVLVLVIIGVLGSGMVNVIIGMILVQWLWYVRIIRSLVLSIKERTFVSAAKVAGTSDMKIIFRHILPNVLPQLIVLSTLDLGSLILHFSGYSFLGFGVQPPTPEWGAMIEEGRRFIRSAPELMFYPGMLITLIVISFNLIGDALRDVLDESVT